MPAIISSAPGKTILFGEHAVVYGYPAIAVPVSQLKAKAIVTANPLGSPGSVAIQAPNVGLETTLGDLPDDHPIAAAVLSVSDFLGLARIPSCTVRVSSTIPVAAGLGSGAAVSVAIIRAFSDFLGYRLSNEDVSALAYEIEKLHHGTPSGIDNTVITYATPVYFVRGKKIETLTVPRPFTIVIGDTGIASPTSVAVGDLRRAWSANPAHFEVIFEATGKIAKRARQLIESGNPEKLGLLMDENHKLLRQMDVSSAELDLLVAAARDAGALGAKLSGGGRGGNMIALVDPEDAHTITQALVEAGAIKTITTQVKREATHS